VTVTKRVKIKLRPLASKFEDVSTPRKSGVETRQMQQFVQKGLSIEGENKEKKQMNAKKRISAEIRVIGTYFVEEKFPRDDG